MDYLIEQKQRERVAATKDKRADQVMSAIVVVAVIGWVCILFFMV